MASKTHLEQMIRDSYAIIREHEQTIQTTSRSEEKLASQRAIERQWENIKGYLSQYYDIPDVHTPADIVEIAAHFGDLFRSATRQTGIPATPSKVSWFKSLPAVQQVALISAIIVALIALIGTLGVPLIEKWLANPTAQPTVEVNPDGSFYYGVRVRIKDKDEAIQGAKVIIEVGGKAPIDDYTDSNGYTRILIPASHAGQPGRLIVEETGYQRWEQNIDLKPDLLPDVIELEVKP
ncbi:MAG: hypothetical protein JW934_14370 [Anaerolineae bacterium]|nr:hypothetical protein [Anaerolineae bacterium]